MGLIRVIAIGLIVWLVISFAKRMLQRSAASKTVAKQTINSKKMVRCDTCGTHVLESEAIQKNGKYYCSTQHLENQS